MSRVAALRSRPALLAAALLPLAACGEAEPTPSMIHVVSGEGIELPEGLHRVEIQVDEGVAYTVARGESSGLLRLTAPVRFGFAGAEPADGWWLGRVEETYLHLLGGELRVGDRSYGPLSSGSTVRLAPDGILVDGERRGDLP